MYKDTSSLLPWGVAVTPVAFRELGMRSRRALLRLGIRTVEELAGCSEIELLGLKNFGQRSLCEVVLFLRKRGKTLSVTTPEHRDSFDADMRTNYPDLVRKATELITACRAAGDYERIKPECVLRVAGRRPPVTTTDT